MNSRETDMNIIISNTSDEPIYRQIAEQIKEMILRGQLKGGDLLPSIRGLARDLRISVITTNRAYEELEKEGFILSVPGKGSFVSEESKEFLREVRLKSLEDKLLEAISKSKALNLSLDELIGMLKILYGEDV
jgi:GntR family transcriptional regulator